MRVLNSNKIIVCLFILFLLVGCNQHQNKPLHRLQWYIDSLYDNTKGDNLVSIAVIDTGVNAEHLDLEISKDIVVPCIDVNNNTNYGHATAVAGVIGAYPHDDKGVLGINPNAKILSLDVMDNSEESQVDCLIEAIRISIEEEVDIINISLGINQDDNRLHSIIKSAYENGIVIVAAVGNEFNEDVLFPAAYNEVLSVGSADKEKNILYKSSDAGDVYAPGVNIVTTYFDSKDGLGYISLNGSSISTPIVSAVISKILEKKPDISNKDIYEKFKEIKYIYSIETMYESFGIIQ